VGGSAEPGSVPTARRPAATAAGSAFSAFDPVAGSVAPPATPADQPSGSVQVAAPASRAAPAQLRAQPVLLTHDLSSRVLTSYVAIFAVVLGGVFWALARRPRRFGGSA
jgi:hypothetical protein